MANGNPETSAHNAMNPQMDAQNTLAVNFGSHTGDHTRNLEGKTLLVTGGASGLGETFVTSFAKCKDAAVIIADLDSSRGERLQKSLREAGAMVKFVRTDVTDWNSVVDLFRSALEWLNSFEQARSIDHVICSAGVQDKEVDLTPVPPEDFLQSKEGTQEPRSLSTRVSIIGSLYTVTAALRYGMGLHKPVSETGDKSIILLASLAGYTGMTNYTDYTASKWGVRGLFRSLLDERTCTFCPVRVNLVAPYFVATPLTAGYIPHLEKLGVKLADISDVQAAALRLMGDRSIHGRALGVWQGGPIDLGDDFGGSFASDAIRKGIESGALIQPSVYVSRPRQES
jgi:5'-hydroxyaverantin dehydrogenase